MLPEIAISLEAGADELEWTVLGAEIDLHESASARSEASPSTSSSSGGDE